MGYSGVKITYRSKEIVAKARTFGDLAARKAAFDTERIAKHYVPVDTGDLEASIAVQKVMEGWYLVNAATAYAAYVEYGTEHETYSIAPQPYMHPAVEAVLPAFRMAMGMIFQQGGFGSITGSEGLS